MELVSFINHLVYLASPSLVRDIITNVIVTIMLVLILNGLHQNYWKILKHYGVQPVIYWICCFKMILLLIKLVELVHFNSSNYELKMI